MQYIQTIIWMMLFVVLVEMLFPSSDMKKYLKLVLGFIVLCVILSPVISLLTEVKLLPEDRIEHYVNYYQREFGTEVTYSRYEDERIKQEEGMLAIYAEKAKRQIIQQVETVEGVALDEVVVETAYNKGYYTVTSIHLEVGYEEQEGLFGIGNKDESIVLDEEVLKKEIKNSLNDFYNWDNTNIYITVQES